MVDRGGAEDGDDILTSHKTKSQGDADVQAQKRILAFKVSHILVSILFLWLLTVQILGLLFFTKGFLLTRLVLESQSQCRVLPDGSSSSVQNGCWHPKKFDKAIIIVIDALRYDFTIPSHAAPADRDPGHHHDNLPLLYNTAIENPNNAFLVPFIADPPTTTLQRLKALMTGTLPVFIDVGSSFAGTAIEEDNLVSHLNASKKVSVHLGDDTWHRLFPDHFEPNLTQAYHSFTTYDLHTVDNGVTEHLKPLLEPQNQNKWDIIFAHFLGVDHAGHTYGPNHPAMAEKLHQMNNVLTEVVKKIDDQTLLVVMGDHGMDAKGDHGGESDSEVEAALWMYSKTSQFGRTSTSTLRPPSTAKERPVGQIDLASTLSLLLGFPVPYNNLGTPIPEAFIDGVGGNLQNLATVELLTFEQIQRYQGEYSQAKDLGTNELQYKLHREVKLAVKESGKDKWLKIHQAYSAWHSETMSMYRRLWANFTISDMLHGVEILAFSLLILILLSRMVAADMANYVPGLLRMIGIGSGIGFLVGPMLGFVIPDQTAVAGCVYGTAVGGILLAFAYAWQNRHLLTTSRQLSVWGWLSLVFCLTQSAGFAANSYTIHEDTILLFFLSTFGAVSFMSSLRQGISSDRILGVYQSIVFMLLTRLSSYSRLCREEQVPGCRSTFYASETSSTSAPWQLLMPFLVALLLPELVKAFYKGTASYAGSAGFWIGFSFRMGLLLVALYWTLDAADNDKWLPFDFSPGTVLSVKLTLARAALAVAIPVGMGTFIWAKPCIDITIEQGEASGDSGEQARPHITILGYANVFGSRFYLMLPMLIITTSLLLPPMGQASIAACAWQVLCLLEILDANSLSVNSVKNASIGPIILAMLGSYHFFKTGHQAVLSSIQWNSAYVPFRTIHYPWSPLLLIFNTFGTQIICAAAVPLTVLWKRPIFKDGLRGLWSDVTNACLTHMLYYATVQLATTMWAGHLRRHLMLYRVFMPRFLMASGVLIIVDVVLIFVALPSVRVTGLSVGEIFGY